MMRIFYRMLFAFGTAGTVAPAIAQTEPIPGNYKDNVTQGNFLLLEENYPMALKFFQEAYRTDSSSANINYKVGLCLLKSVAEKKNSLPYLRRAAKDITRNYDEFEPRIKKAPEITFYYLAQSYHLNSKFDSAQSMFESYKTLLSTNKNPELARDVDHRIQVAKNAMEFTASPLPLKITNMGDSINCPEPDYSPVMSLDENIIYFTSRRAGERGIDGLYYEDIMVSYRKADGTWTTAAPLSGVNTSTNEATISVSTDGQMLFIYKDENGGDIYFSTQDANGVWSAPLPMEGDFNTKGWETHACMSADGNTIYFVSDRSGGLGGRDIYRCVKLPNGRWSKALNLGPSINTPYDEDSPFIHPDRVTLFFSSKGHKSMGGFDIFFTAQNDSGAWAEPVNMGYPINTPDDDVFYITSVDGRRAYFSSVREGSLGDKDIYMAELEKPAPEPPLTLIRFKIFNADNSPLTQDVQVIVSNNETGEQVGIFRPDRRTGSMAIILPPGATYKLVYMVNGTEYYTEIVNVPADSDYQTYEQALSINDLMLGKVKDIQSKDTTTTLPPKDTMNVKTTKKLEFINIEAMLMQKSNVSEPVASPVGVTLKNDKGEILGETTSRNGKFSFKHLPAQSNYLVLIDEFSNVAKIVSPMVSNFDDNKELKATKTSTKTEEKLKVAATNKVVTMRLKKPEPAVKEPLPKDTLRESLTSVRGLNFQMFFKYNISEIDQSDPDFTKFIDTLMVILQRQGSVKLKLDASASQVPTRKWPSNQVLAQDRADKCKSSVMNALKARGADPNKITWVKVGAYVLGPKYKNDPITGVKKYEKYQYVKIRGFD